jgi:4-amino-4-deoxy-L-arabinose transferase-like glycosyltransferase
MRDSLADGSDGDDRFQNLLIIALALIALALKLLVQWHLPLELSLMPVDSSEYLDLAAGIRHGCGFARWAGGLCQQGEILRTPGYPLFLALFSGPGPALAAQAFVSSAQCLLVAWWVRRSWGFRAALIAETLIAFDLPSLVMANLVMSDLLFQFALLLAVVPPLLIVSGRIKHVTVVTLLCSAAAGFAILTRPIALTLPLVMPIALLFTHIERRRRLALAAVAFIIPAFVMSFWIVRNYRVGEYAGLSTVSAINLYFFRAANITARTSGRDFDSVQKEFGERLGQSYKQVLSAPAQSRDIVRRMTEDGEKILMSHPGEAVKATIQGAVYMAIVPDRSMLARQLGLRGGYRELQVGLNAGAPNVGRFKTEINRIRESPTLVALLAFQMLLLGAMWMGCACALIRCRRASGAYRVWVLFLGGVAVMFIVLAAGGEAAVRFRAPVVPLLAIVASLGYSQRTQDA